MNTKATEKTELNKILAIVAEYATLSGGKEKLKRTEPETDLSKAKKRLTLTEECEKLLFRYGVSKIEAFPPLNGELDRAKKGSVLSCGELLKIGALLRSVRIARESVSGVSDPDIKEIRKLSENLYYDAILEDDIFQKILNDEQLSDRASDKLYALRREIRLLNDRIRTRLSEYLTGDEGKFLQDAIVTMRNDRYVLPVRAEYKRSVKGFVHDRSASGATFFIEPEEILEMNNELRSLALDEREEVERILKDLTFRVGALSDRLKDAVEILEETDGYYARAEYGYKLSAVRPELNDKGMISVTEGRHPLIDKKTVVPVTFSLGREYRILLVSGPNTGGKTVTLKMTGLFCLMAMCGIFIPAKQAELSVFNEIFCDIGDSQSIEESLSTFSSHIANVIEIVEHTDEKTLVLIDEPGGGTDPEEGQALAKAIVSYLLNVKCRAVVTTHYSALKEFAFSADGIENACMEFDSNTLRPLYVLRIGLPGASNALAIAGRLGLRESILSDALSNLSEGAQAFEHIVRSAEESRVKADEALRETNRIKAEWREKTEELEREREKFKKEKEKFTQSARAESKRIIQSKTAEAEELLAEMESIFAEKTVSEADLIRARTLKNKLADKAYDNDEEESEYTKYLPVDAKTLKVNDRVFVKSIGGEAVVQSVRVEKKEAEVLCGNLRVRCKFSDLFSVISSRKAQTVKTKPKEKEKVSVYGSFSARRAPRIELNVIGKTVLDALPDVEAFLDDAVLANLEEVRIVHGAGTGKLRSGIHAYLKTQPHVKSFRIGVYGEGDSGVTIVTLA